MLVLDGIVVNGCVIQLFRADAKALAFYQDKTNKKITPQQAQNALESLRERTPAMVWKSSRREYAV
jgi:hypothetical protein